MDQSSYYRSDVSLGWVSISEQSRLRPSFVEKNYISHFSKYSRPRWFTFERQSPLVAVGIMTLESAGGQAGWMGQQIIRTLTWEIADHFLFPTDSQHGLGSLPNLEYVDVQSRAKLFAPSFFLQCQIRKHFYSCNGIWGHRQIMLS